MRGKERRLSTRYSAVEPEPAIVHLTLESAAAGQGRAFHPLFVAVQDISSGGVLMESPRAFSPGELLTVTLYDCAQKQSNNRRAQVAWQRLDTGKTLYLIGLQYLEGEVEADEATRKQLTALCADISFLLSTKLFTVIGRHALWPMLNGITICTVPEGKRLMVQGDEGDSFYLVQEGSCVVQVEREGVLHTVARIGPGEVVGEMTVLTGEPRRAHVDAESNAILWRIDRGHFDAISVHSPDLQEFLTDLLTRRLETTRHVADRSIGKYLIRHKLGQGAWSIVFQGTHTLLNMQVAVKMLKHRAAMNEDFHRRFMEEAQIIARITHRNIVQIYDIEEAYKTVFIVMEYLEGESLEGRLRRTGPMAAAEAAAILAQVAAGLAFAHGKGIIHQDIKPANLHILPNEQVKIVDFGLACVSGSEELDMEGTLFYMAPEQIDGGRIDARTDVYALGITAFEMVTGKRPFPEDDLSALMDMHLEQDIPDPAALVPELEPEMRSFILTAGRKDPEERFQNMDEALDRLAPILERSARRAAAPDIREKRLTSLFLFYHDEQRGDVNRLLEDIGNRAQEMGIVFRAADFRDM